MIIEHNATTGEITQREMTAEELAQFQADEVKATERKAAQATSEAARQAILDRLGLTADEAALLLGAN